VKKDLGASKMQAIPSLNNKGIDTSWIDLLSQTVEIQNAQAAAVVQLALQ
jgi:hypothetical protein